MRISHSEQPSTTRFVTSTTLLLHHPIRRYSNKDAVVESGLCDIFGPSFNDSRGILITSFQCLDWGQPQSLAHHFHMGCIGTYVWKCCITSEFGRRQIEDVTCPLCSRRITGDIVLTARASEQGSRFPFQGMLRPLPPASNIQMPACLDSTAVDPIVIEGLQQLQLPHFRR